MSVRSMCAGFSLGVGLVCQPGVASAQDKPDAAKAGEGERVYGEHCQVCHGENLVSSGQSFDLRTLTPGDRKRYETVVQNGKGQMPPWRGVIDDDEIDKIWHFIMSRRS